MADQTFHEYLTTLLHQFHLPALGAAVGDGQGVVEQAVVGVRKWGTGDPVRPADRFHLGSVTKPITATMIGKLVEEGTASWGTTLLDVFPERKDHIHPQLQGVTLEQLLSHWAGIQPFEDDEEFEALPPFEGTRAEKRAAFARWLVEQPPHLTPGTQHVYSNAGYTLAGVMAERLAGRAWEELVRQKIFAPLGIDQAGFGWPAQAGATQPWGHWDKDEGIVPHDPDDSYQVNLIEPAGAVHASLGDMLRFAHLHLNGLLGQDGWLKAETIRKLHDAPEAEYALGWNVRSFGNHHLGGAGTFFAVLMVSPGDRRVYAMATNCGTRQSGDLGSELISYMKREYKEGG